MVIDTAGTLYKIAGRKAADGSGWDALNAQLAADALTITAELENNRGALLDIGPLKALDLTGAGLAGVVREYRRQLLKGLESWGIAGTVGAALPEITLPEIPLDPAEAGWFADDRLAGRSLGAFSEAERARGRRFAALAGRMHDMGDAPAALRSARAADNATFAAHYGAEAAAVDDGQLAALRTGLLLVEELLAGTQAPGGPAAAGIRARAAYDASNLTDKPIHWESISYLS